MYIGDAVHKGTAYPGEHEAIISLDLWNRVHGIIKESPRVRACRTRTTEPALLKGLIFGPTGGAMSPTYYDAAFNIPLVGAAFANRISYVISPDGKILYAYSDSNAEKHIENTLAVVKKWRAEHKR